MRASSEVVELSHTRTHPDTRELFTIDNGTRPKVSIPSTNSLKGTTSV